jgi:hypothetical protein
MLSIGKITQRRTLWWLQNNEFQDVPKKTVFAWVTEPHANYLASHYP